MDTKSQDKIKQCFLFTLLLVVQAWAFLFLYPYLLILCRMEPQPVKIVILYCVATSLILTSLLFVVQAKIRKDLLGFYFTAIIALACMLIFIALFYKRPIIW